MAFDETEEQLEKRRKEYLMERLRRENPVGRHISKNVIALGYEGVESANEMKAREAAPEPEPEKKESPGGLFADSDRPRPSGPDIYHQHLIEQSYALQLERRLGANRRSKLVPGFLFLVFVGVLIDGRAYNFLMKTTMARLSGAEVVAEAGQEQEAKAPPPSSYTNSATSYQAAAKAAAQRSKSYAQWLASQGTKVSSEPRVAAALDGSASQTATNDQASQRTTLRSEPPEGTWTRGSVITLVTVQARVRNVGKVEAKNIQVYAEVPGGSRVRLSGPSRLSSHESAVYTAQPNEIVRVAGNLGVAMDCDNCRN